MVRFNEELDIPVTAETATKLPPGRNALAFTASAPVTVTSLVSARKKGRVISIKGKPGTSAVTLTHTAPGSATAGKMSFAGGRNQVIRAGDCIFMQEQADGNWLQIGQAPIVVIVSSSGGTSRVIAHGLGTTPTVASVTVTTSAGVLGSGWTLGTVDGTNVNLTLANATDIVRLVLIP